MSAETIKKLRYVSSFLRRRLIHTNLQILYRCNFRCRICDFWRGSFAGYPDLDVADAVKISERLVCIGPQIVSIGGGEPLLHRDLVEITAILARHHFPVMISNGWHMTRELARALFLAGMYEISVSVDYADSRRHDDQRGVEGAFDRAVRALATLEESRVHPHQRVNMITVVMDDNLEEMEPLIRLSKEINVGYLVTLYSGSRGDRSVDDPRSEMSARLLALKRKHPEFAALRGYLARFTEAARNDGIGPCYAGKNLCNIDSLGNVSFCIDRAQEPVGNILEEDIHAIEERLLSGFLNNKCRACWTSCRGSVETLMYGNQRLLNMLDYYRMTRSEKPG